MISKNKFKFKKFVEILEALTENLANLAGHLGNSPSWTLK